MIVNCFNERNVKCINKIGKIQVRKKIEYTIRKTEIVIVLEGRRDSP